jgi:flagellar biosynthesis GTPase FlhF
MTDLLEETQELLAKYKRLKDDKIIMIDAKGYKNSDMYYAFTLEEIMRLSKLIENEI